MRSSAETYGAGRRSVWARIATAAGILGLVLRLAWPGPFSAVAQPDLAAIYGEHALCLSLAGGERPADQVPEPPGGHSDHDAAGCCPWHFGGAVILPGSTAATRVVFAVALEPRTAGTEHVSALRVMAAQPRAPPSASG